VSDLKLGVVLKSALLGSKCAEYKAGIAPGSGRHRSLETVQRSQLDFASFAVENPYVVIVVGILIKTCKNRTMNCHVT
jgi:hypothetical protein